jgi:aspartyl-tRNA synthetase
MHHAFTSPLEEDTPLLESDPLKVRADSYDLVLNGVELGSGSLRVFEPELQRRILRNLGMTDDEITARFGFLLRAYEYGGPPHRGFALGLDRIIALMAGVSSIREVIAFPKTTSAQCPLTGAPSDVSEDQLAELGLKTSDDD